MCLRLWLTRAGFTSELTWLMSWVDMVDEVSWHGWWVWLIRGYDLRKFRMLYERVWMVLMRVWSSVKQCMRGCVFAILLEVIVVAWYFTDGFVRSSMQCLTWFVVAVCRWREPTYCCIVLWLSDEWMNNWAMEINEMRGSTHIWVT